jgi:hypothetical protein
VSRIKPIQNSLKTNTGLARVNTNVQSNMPNAQQTAAALAANIAKMQANLAKPPTGAPTSKSNTSTKNKKVNTNTGGAMTLPATVDRPTVFGSSPAPTISISSAPTYTPPDVIVRIPERDIVNYQDDDIPTELITNLLFENLGANELVKFERHDTVEGTNASYDIISNLSNIRRSLDPAALISRQKPDTSYFDIFNIKLENKIPTELYLRNNPKIDATGEVNTNDYVYIDQEGNLVIELVNIESDEILEVEIDSNGTIYEVKL